MKPVRNLVVQLYACSLFTLFGCTPKTAVSTPPQDSIEFSSAFDDVEQFIGKRVRWGGIIQNVINKAETTEVEIVQTPTTKRGRPYTDKGTKGRFKAVLDGFIDPTTFAEGNMLTVIGTIAGTDNGYIDEFAYTYPLVNVEDYQQWDRAAYELNKRRRMNIGFGWHSGGHRGVGVGWGWDMPYNCDIYGDC